MQRTIQNISICQSTWLFMSTRGKQSRSEEKSSSSVRGTGHSVAAMLVFISSGHVLLLLLRWLFSCHKGWEMEVLTTCGYWITSCLFFSYKMFSLTSAKLSFDLSSSWVEWTVLYDCRVGIHCCFPRLIFKVYSYLRI